MLQIKYTSINNDDDDKEAVWRQNMRHQHTGPSSPLKGWSVTSLLTPLFPGGQSRSILSAQESSAQPGPSGLLATAVCIAGSG